MDEVRKMFIDELRAKSRKFRGKSIRDGRLVYGSLLIVKDRTFIIEDGDLMINGDGSLEFSRDVYEVDYSSVDVRLYEAAGASAEIYEGDMFEQLCEITDRKKTVCYGPGDVLNIYNETLIASMGTIMRDVSRKCENIENITEYDLRRKFRHIQP